MEHDATYTKMTVETEHDPNHTNKSRRNVDDVGDTAIAAQSLSFLLTGWNKYGIVERSMYHLDLMSSLILPGSSSESVKEKEKVSDVSILHQQHGQHRRRSSVKKIDLEMVQQQQQSLMSSDEIQNHYLPTYCGVIKILECIPVLPVSSNGTQSRLPKRLRRNLRRSLLKFNQHADESYYKQTTSNEEYNGAKNQLYSRIYEPKTSMPLAVAPGTRMSFCYDVTRIVICVDASSALTSSLLSPKTSKRDECCPIDNLEKMITTYMQAIISPIEISGQNTTFVPDILVSIFAVYAVTNDQISPNSDEKVPECEDISILVKCFQVDSRQSALILGSKVRAWVRGEVEHGITSRLSKAMKASNNVFTESSIRKLLSASEVVLRIMPLEARPIVIIATACMIQCECETSLNDPTWRDIPIHIFDLSQLSSSSNQQIVTPTEILQKLHLAHCKESLYQLCESKSGRVFDWPLLSEAAVVLVGKISPSSRFYSDPFLASKRRSMYVNILQWYTLFSVSPLSPATGSGYGRSISFNRKSQTGDELSLSQYSMKDVIFSNIVTSHSFPRLDTVSIQSKLTRNKFSDRSIFTYSLPLITIKGILSQRVKEGFRTKKYGTYTWDPNKLSIHLTFTVFHATIHYEVSFEAASNHCRQVGRALCRIYVSFNSNCRSGFYDDFDIHAIVIKLARAVKEADSIEAFLCREKDNPITDDFCNRLEPLVATDYIFRHFRVDEFEVLTLDRGGYSDEGRERYSGENDRDQISDVIKRYCTHTISLNRVYLKQFTGSKYTIMSYCIVRVTPVVGTLFRISVGFFAVDTTDCQSFLLELKNLLSSRNKYSVVLPKQLSDIVDVQNIFGASLMIANKFRHNESWELRYDPELLPLVSRRRLEIGNFMLVHQLKGRKLFAKFVNDKAHYFNEALSNFPSESRLVTYEIDCRGESALVHIQMDVPNGFFFPSISNKYDTRYRVERQSAHDIFQTIYKTVRRRDQECGEALHSRSKLLMGDGFIEDIERLLPYCSADKFEMRFFAKSPESELNSTLLNLTSSFLVSEFTSANICSVNVPKERGKWFILQFPGNDDLLCLLNISSEQIPKETYQNDTYRWLTFYSFAISDLYTTKLDEDTTDDEISPGIGRCFNPSPFADIIIKEHHRNFARAAYFYLRSQASSTYSFESSDLKHVLSTFHDSAVAEAFVTVQDATCISSLQNIFKGLLSPIQLSSSCEHNLYYFSNKENDDDFVNIARSEVERAESNAAVFDDLHVDDDENFSCSSAESSEGLSLQTDFEQSECDDNVVSVVCNNSHQGDVSIETKHSIEEKSCPLFVKILLDNHQEILLEDIPSKYKSAKITVCVSTFDFATNLSSLPSKVHYAFAQMIRTRLNKFVAAQQLERLRHIGPDISSIDLTIAMKYAAQAHDITESIPINVYSPRQEHLCVASPAIIADNELDLAYKLFIEELLEANILSSKIISSHSLSFFAVPDSACVDLEFWLFFRLHKERALLVVALHHPQGSDAAQKVLLSFREKWSQVAHRVNQKLLLESLHLTKIASHLLIPTEQYFDSGCAFACPIVFSHSFPLHHRCELHKTIVALGSSVLHQFAVSNRQGIFVYRDEQDHIVYMTLEAGVDVVRLVVRGVDSVGISVTSQLCRLLEKKMMSIALEQLTSLLCKNPYFELKLEDLNFLETYEMSMGINDDDKQQSEYIFNFPSIVNDPLLVCCMFRQNICGSAYFHRLAIADKSSLVDNDAFYSNMDQEENVARFVESNFSFFYINTPTPLNNNLQSTSTLTHKGAHFARHTGGGVALVRIQLLQNGAPLSRCKVGDEIQQNTLLNPEVIKMERVDGSNQTGNCFSLKITIVNTSLRIDVLFDWIELSLNQSIVGWLIERHLSVPKLLLQSNGQYGKTLFHCNEESYNRVCGGLPLLLATLHEAKDLPHPAVDFIEVKVNIWATALATLSFDLLHEVLLKVLFQDKPLVNVTALRSLIVNNEVKSAPVEVQFKRDKKSDKVHVLEKEVGSLIVDEYTDEPEYIFVIGIGDKVSGSTFRTSLLFQETTIDESETDLVAIKSLNKDIFDRSIALILITTRSYRRLYLYNIHPQTSFDIRDRIHKIEDRHSKTIYRSLFYQSRVIRSFSPLNIGTNTNDKILQSTSHQKDIEQKKNIIAEKKNSVLPIDGNESRQQGRFRKLSNMDIRKPRLVGKSVEGSAVQAQLAARDRASSRIGGGAKSKRLGASSQHPSSSSIASQSHTRDDRSLATQRSTNDLVSIGDLSYAEDQSKTSSSFKPPNNIVDVTEHLRLLSSISLENTGDAITISYKMLNSILGSGILILSESCVIPIPWFEYKKCSSETFPMFCAKELSQKIKILNVSITGVTDKTPRSHLYYYGTEERLYLRCSLGSYFVSIIEATSIKSGAKSQLGRIRVWLLNLLGTNKDVSTGLPLITRKKVKSYLRKVKGWCNIDKLVYNYSVHLLKEVLFSDEHLRSHINTQDLACKLCHIYKENSIKLKEVFSTRVYEYNLCLPSDNTGIRAFDFNMLLKYANSTASRYGLYANPMSSQSTVWFKVPEFEETAYCVIGTKGDNLLLLVFCKGFDESNSLDSFLRIGQNSTDLIMRSDYIGFMAKSFTLSCFSRLASDLLRESLWAAFSGQRTAPWTALSQNPFPPTFENLKRLCLLSHCIDIKNTDKRLADLFSSEINDLKLDWHHAMARLKLFFMLLLHEILQDRNDSQVYLFYSRSIDEFLIIFELSKNGNIIECFYLTRDGTKTNTVVDQLINIFLEWIWDQT